MLDTSRSRAYDLSKPEEHKRLLHELEGYMRTSLTDGTDHEGRRHALDALIAINRKAKEPVKSEGESLTWREGWQAHAAGWPLYAGHTKPYQDGWRARAKWVEGASP